MKLFAKKSLGQHFLNSKYVLEQIISAAKISAGENILEIGPGTGVLTEELLRAGAHVVAVEKDTRAIDILREKFADQISSGALTIIHGDILEYDSPFPPTGALDPSSSFALIANIPYYITGAILEKFLEHGPRPSRMVLLVQKEVADRIVANESTGFKESILSISVKAFGTPHIISKVPRGAFSPPPTVDSAILAIDDISGSRLTNIRRFFEIVRAGFAHKRKYLKRNIEAVIEPAVLDEIWKKNDLDEKVRAEELNLDQWINIAH